MWNKVLLMPVEMWKKIDINALLISVEKVSFNPVEMWKTKYQLVVQILCGKLYRMPWRIGVEKHHFCSDVREQSITLSPLNVNTSVYIL